MHLLLLASLITASRAAGCFEDGKACEAHESNTIETITDVANVEECRAFCDADPACSFLTYFGLLSFPFVNTCMTFSSCASQYSCDDCRTEESGCFGTCGISFHGQVDNNNLLEIKYDIDDELNCKVLCENRSECIFYTYYASGSDINPYLCILMKGIQGPIIPCVDCKTGPKNCRNNTCLLLDSEAKMVRNLMITEPSLNTTVSLFSFKSCTLTALAVGGGGDFGSASGVCCGAGGGSGYIKTNSVIISASTSQLLVTVGGSGMPSFVHISEELFLEANAGKDAIGMHGGDGYSGGGGGSCDKYGGGNGGSNGEDGYGQQGKQGKGSKFKLDDINLKYFNLSPGNGGTHDYTSRCGGGGGGLLVDGSGPQTSDGNAGGYGAGGSHAKPGCVILEI